MPPAKTFIRAVRPPSRRRRRPAATEAVIEAPVADAGPRHRRGAVETGRPGSPGRADLRPPDDDAAESDGQEGRRGPG